MPEKDEFERYKIPTSMRIQLYKGSLSLTITLMIIFLYLYIKCNTYVNDLWGDRLNDFKEMVDMKVDKVSDSIGIEIREIKRTNDSLSTQVEAIKEQ